VSEDRPGDKVDAPGSEEVEEAAAHASRAVSHRREMQRSAVRAEAAEGDDEAELEQKAADHGAAAKGAEADADSAAQRADDES
jgi:hypothetical protein